MKRLGKRHGLFTYLKLDLNNSWASGHYVCVYDSQFRFCTVEIKGHRRVNVQVLVYFKVKSLPSV